MTVLGLSSRLAIRPSFTQLSPTTLDKGGVYAPAGYILLRGADGSYLKGADGAYLYGRAA